ncbi:N-formylglutamate amidohydrolase [Sphingomonas sp. BIUV-7]|uniref:N-formylglutamate amidohydrolase n=1 Tax=Sphingomonas natans TaxID=3063330 RepID=A0ABT8YB73_9SPHN|nr:N-formylglutamate amidohydrolase [Sphingomonas sp. BIUV-7]MDO6415583.1 N-formylglutamate amidohydrolase [Sphingomonas sp. BIUV-7]
MRSSSNGPLLAADDPPPVSIHNEGGCSPFLLVGDHAGNAIPRQLGDLGLSDADRVRHIAWDIGSRDLGFALAGRLDAVFIHQTYSRLVIDCNRDPASREAMPATSDGSAIPANRDLPAAEIAARISEVHAAYHDAIAAEIDRRRLAGRHTILVSLHSFTPVMNGVARPWQISILFDRDPTGFSRALLGSLSGTDLVVGENEPYRMDETDYTVPRHAHRADLAYAEIEIRQDELLSEDSVRRMADMVGTALEVARRAIV